MFMGCKSVKLGMIGLGPRAETLLATLRGLPPEECQVTAVCDINPARVTFVLDLFARNGLPQPRAYADHKALLADPEVEAVLIPTGWNSHLGIAGDAMAAGKYAGIEVGGASSLEELWHLVRNAEQFGGSCMMLENCCYGRNELLVMNLVRKGLFGEIVHCSCGYEHDIAYELIDKNGLMCERGYQNYSRNGDLYPTHGLGPLAKILNINRGNRFMTISSFASKACGFKAYAEKIDSPCRDFAMGDVITSVIKCANGETITLTHSVSLPRPYSRDGRVQGTKGIWLEDAKGIFIDGISETKTEIDVAGNPYYTHVWDPVSKFYEEYDHPIWQEFRDNPTGGHGGMDTLALRAFLDAVRNRTVPPIDVYDCAAWMAVTALSEASVAAGGMPMPFPDFTNGKWIYPVKEKISPWDLNA
ncbi:MAG: Gfo/Idh/MocA family oxidoreductase [Lentisphaeria bacterium]|nr:Gfo/Idh/MocA family oxidoreductase [Lentisphaeria bacterium]